MVAIPDDELPVRALVSIWVDMHDTRAAYESILSAAGIRRAGYLVTESLYCDYGDNEHASPQRLARRATFAGNCCRERVRQAGRRER